MKTGWPWQPSLNVTLRKAQPTEGSGWAGSNKPAATTDADPSSRRFAPFVRDDMKTGWPWQPSLNVTLRKAQPTEGSGVGGFERTGSDYRATLLTPLRAVRSG